MDKGLRNALRLATVACRKALETDYALQLEGTFGIERGGEIQPEERLTHLTPRQRELRRQMVATIAHRQAGGATPAEAVTRFVREAAFSSLNRLAALKLMEAPERGLILESIGAGQDSRGFRQFKLLSPEALRPEPDGGYALYLDLLDDDLAEEIGVLFDRDAPQAALAPSKAALTEVLGRLNDPALAPVWSEDETLGWIYQYFTPKEQRDEARKASAAPRNAYELAFRNQFFTPRYVVEFLTDNTLGRTWYEMRQGKTALAERCRYLVIWPDEVFLSPGARWDSEDPDASFLQGNTDTIAPFRVPVTEWRGGEEIEERVFTMPWSDIGEDGLRLTRFAHLVRPFAWVDDPRRESWNRLLEQLSTVEPQGPLEERTQDLWDLLLALARANRIAEGTVAEHSVAMTAIANEIRQRLLSARDPDASTEERLRAPYLVPHRPKKDPRELRILDPACGSGHFLLYAFDLLLTIYDEAYDDEDLGPALQRDYPDREAFRRAVPELILRHNLHGVDIDLRAVQIAQLALWLRAQRAYAAWEFKPADRPRITRVNVVAAEPMPGDRGLQAEFLRTLDHPAIARLVADVWTDLDAAGPIDEIGSLLKADVLVRDLVAQHKRDWQSDKMYVPIRLFGDPEPEQARLDLDLRFISDDAFWQGAEREVLDELRRFAESANGDTYRRRLFAEDAAQGFALLELFREPFDVVLMNPPFGAVSPGARAYVDREYPSSKNDLYAVFVERGLDLLRPCGHLGAITSRTGFFLTMFRKWREEIILGGSRVHTMADLGQGVLDTAMVETAAYVLKRIA